MTAISSGAANAVSTPVEAIHPVRVWILPPTLAQMPDSPVAYKYEWLASGWTQERRLIPAQSEDVAGATGTATFRLLRRAREENGTSVVSSSLVRGAYVAITCGPTSASLVASEVKWWGWITNVDATVITGTDDTVGSVTAQQLGGLLDSAVCAGWQQQSATAGYPEPIGSAPTANYAVADGKVVGNMVAIGAPTVYVFARLPTSCGTDASNYWSRWKLLQHLVAYCLPDALPGFTIDAPAAVEAYLDDVTTPEVFDLRDLTVKGALDLLLPRSRGIGWHLYPTADLATWTVKVYTHDPDGTYLAVGATEAANTPVDVNLRTECDATEVVWSESALDEYDQIIVRGEPIVCGVTVSKADGNFDKAWTAAQETAYRAGATPYPGGVSTDADKLSRNLTERQSAGLGRVFTSYTLNAFNADGGLSINRKTDPGLGTGSLVALVPRVDWIPDKGYVRLSEGASLNCQPYLPTARLLRFLPWPEGLEPDGTDRRDASMNAQPTYLTPKLFRYIASPPASDGEKWLDLLAHGNANDSTHANRGTPQVDVDDRSLGLRIVYSPPEVLAKGHWTTGTDAICALNPNDPNTDAKGLDWEKVVATVALESSQRVEVTKTRPGLPDAAVRRRLVISDPGLKFWMMAAGSVLGVTKTKPNDADRVTAQNSETWLEAASRTVAYVTRNDYPTAQRIADMASAWVFRPRQAVTIRCAFPGEARAWATIGTMLGTLTEQTANAALGTQAVTRRADTVVERVVVDWMRGPGASLTVSTTPPERPDFLRMAGASSSASHGGSVSASLGGTVAQAVLGVQREAVRAERDAVNVPVHPPRVLGGTVLQVKVVLVSSGQTLDSGQTGVKYAASSIVDVPSAYDPAVTSTFINGIGRGTLYINGVAQSGFVLIRNDSNSPVQRALIAGDVVAVHDTVALTVAGDPNTTVNAYPVFFL